MLTQSSKDYHSKINYQCSLKSSKKIPWFSVSRDYRKQREPRVSDYIHNYSRFVERKNRNKNKRIKKEKIRAYKAKWLWWIHARKIEFYSVHRSYKFIQKLNNDEKWKVGSFKFKLVNSYFKIWKLKNSDNSEISKRLESSKSQDRKVKWKLKNLISKSTEARTLLLQERKRKEE